jgi:hypothetical protein
LNDGRIQNPSSPFGIVPLSNFVPRGFGFVYHSIAILYHEVPNPNLTIRNFFIAVERAAVGSEPPAPSQQRVRLPITEEDSDDDDEQQALPCAAASVAPAAVAAGATEERRQAVIEESDRCCSRKLPTRVGVNTGWSN